MSLTSSRVDEVSVGIAIGWLALQGAGSPPEPTLWSLPMPLGRTRLLAVQSLEDARDPLGRVLRLYRAVATSRSRRAPTPGGRGSELYAERHTTSRRVMASCSRRQAVDRVRCARSDASVRDRIRRTDRSASWACGTKLADGYGWSCSGRVDLYVEWSEPYKT